MGGPTPSPRLGQAGQDQRAVTRPLGPGLFHLWATRHPSGTCGHSLAGQGGRVSHRAWQGWLPAILPEQRHVVAGMHSARKQQGGRRLSRAAKRT